MKQFCFCMRARLKECSCRSQKTSLILLQGSEGPLCLSHMSRNSHSKILQKCTPLPLLIQLEDLAFRVTTWALGMSGPASSSSYHLCCYLLQNTHSTPSYYPPFSLPCKPVRIYLSFGLYSIPKSSTLGQEWGKRTCGIKVSDLFKQLQRDTGCQRKISLPTRGACCS